MSQEARLKDRSHQATEVLRRLDQLGAIKLDVLLAKAMEIREIVGGSVADDIDDHPICYKNYIHIGPRDLDLVSVTAQVKELGFDLVRTVGHTQVKG
jgi:hypothetical protein